MRADTFGFVVYLTVALLTWGWIAAAPCDVQMKDDCVVQRARGFITRGFPGGALWPVYWSYYVAAKVRR